ncbi:MAG: hypothetical protein K2I71_03130 [Helicobacter sp.]|nr:hypothetical protein [Helicobacter sp.]
MKVTTEKELAEALKNGEETIEIEGDLAKGVIHIKETGENEWYFAVGEINHAATSSIFPTFNLSNSSLPARAVGILGTATTATAISIAVAAGGVGILNRLRDYDMKKISDTHVSLTKS